MLKIKNISIFISSILVLTGCAHNEEAFDMSNPASVYCKRLGGKAFVPENAKTYRLHCMMPNGEVKDAWWIYNNKHRTNPVIYTGNVQ